MLDLDELARLGFDDETKGKKEQYERARLSRESLKSMEKQGAIVLEREGKNEGWLILEPVPKSPGEDLPSRTR